jgi:Flp pilus assembly protein TadG
MNLFRSKPIEEAKKNSASGAPGQGMVEFALALPVLLLLLFGVIEVGRLMVMYSSVQAASREAARYAAAAGSPNGSTTPYYMDTTGITAAAQRISTLIGVTQVVVSYDHGPNAGSNNCPGTAFNPASADAVSARDRVNVTVRANYQPFLGITPLKAFQIQATTCRTIVKDIPLADFSGVSGGANTPPTVNITAPVTSGATFDGWEGDCINFAGTANDAEDGALTNINWNSNIDGAIGTGNSFTKCTLALGTHTISAQATDSGGMTGQATITVVIHQKTPPVLVVTSPANGAIFNVGQTIDFNASATNYLGQDISAQITWNDSLNGLLYTGGSFSSAGLSTGSHTLTVSVTDPAGTDTEIITFSVVADAAPDLQITAPGDGTQVLLNSVVTLSGIATDAIDGNLSGSIHWSSNLDGALGTGASLSTSTLREGTHSITASVTDSGGHTTTKSITVYVTKNAPPVVTFDIPPNPVNMASVVQGVSITFQATALDALDGNLSSNLDWYSDKNGYLGKGKTLVRNTSASPLSVGTHLIRAEVTDSGGQLGSNSFYLVVTTPNTPPQVFIDRPVSNANIKATIPYNFQGHATDAEDGPLSSVIQWYASKDGYLGQGANLTGTLTTLGSQVISATVTDSGGLSATAVSNVNVTAPICPQPAGNPTFTKSGNNFTTMSWSLTVSGIAPSTTEYLKLLVLKLTIGTISSGGRVSDVKIDTSSVAFTGNGLVPVNLAAPVTLIRSSNTPISIVWYFNPNMGNKDKDFTVTASFEGCPDITGYQSDPK